MEKNKNQPFSAFAEGNQTSKLSQNPWLSGTLPLAGRRFITMEVMVRRVYNNRLFGVKKSLDFDKVIFLQEGDKVPGDFVNFQLLLSGEIPIGFLETLTLFEVGCSSNEPGFVYKVVSIPDGTYINKEMVVERY